MTGALVGLVLVSHSSKLALGLSEVAGQMAPGVRICPAGGDDGEGLGTSLDKVAAALAGADAGSGTVVLYDLGSARMIADTALELLDDEQRARVRVVDAPLVEGALTAAVAAAGGGDLEEVMAALAVLPAPAEPGTASTPGGPAERAEVTLVNSLGLHARPAALVVRGMAAFDAEVTVGPVGGGPTASARSLLGLVGLGAGGGQTLRIEARGPQAADALQRLAAMVAEGLGDADREGAVPAGAVPGMSGTGAAGLVTSGRGEPVGLGELAGIPASHGVAVGHAVYLERVELEIPDVPGRGEREERRRLDLALAAVEHELPDAGGPAGAGEMAGVLDVHGLILRDPELSATAGRALSEGASAERAWWGAACRARGQLAQAGTGLAAGRAVDVEDVGRRVLAALARTREPGGAGSEPARRTGVAPGSVVLAVEVLPSEVQLLAADGAAALVAERGAPTAHAALLARAAGLPFVVGVAGVATPAGVVPAGVPGPGRQGVQEGTTVLVDGTRGLVVVDPSPERQDQARRAMKRAAAARDTARRTAPDPVTLADGTALEVAANVGSLADARAAVENGADGVGLLRTELLYSAQGIPGEDEQVGQLSAILAVLGDRPVIVRTADLGGDKRIPGLDLDPVRHGFLGQRGLRLSLARPALLVTQLRAILRAGAGHQVSVMFPMVTLAEELRVARELLDQVVASLSAEGAAFAPTAAVGAMVEVPAAALAAGELVGEVDFFSIGSNDLVQYVMAADRTNPAVASLYRPDHPAIGRLIDEVCQAARAAGRWVGVCGEMAADPESAAWLVTHGVRELSMPPPAIPAVKARLRGAAGVVE